MKNPKSYSPRVEYLGLFLMDRMEVWQEKRSLGQIFTLLKQQRDNINIPNLERWY